MWTYYGSIPWWAMEPPLFGAMLICRGHPPPETGHTKGWRENGPNQDCPEREAPGRNLNTAPALQGSTRGSLSCPDGSQRGAPVSVRRNGASVGHVPGIVVGVLWIPDFQKHMRHQVACEYQAKTSPCKALSLEVLRQHVSERVQL